jgi:dTMP kinase
VTRGRLVAFEGGEGCGKSTQARLLADALGALLTFEPGATPLGAAIRALVLDPDAVVGGRAEALLMAADRAQHVAEVVEPALAAGRHVVTDRFVGSSLAYQGFGRGLDVDALADLSRWATGGVAADLVVLLDVAPDLARHRLQGRPDRFESEDAAFHERVAGGFRALAAADPARWLVVDGTAPIDEVHAAVLAGVRARLAVPA